MKWLERPFVKPRNSPTPHGNTIPLPAVHPHPGERRAQALRPLQGPSALSGLRGPRRCASSYSLCRKSKFGSRETSIHFCNCFPLRNHPFSNCRFQVPGAERQGVSGLSQATCHLEPSSHPAAERPRTRKARCHQKGKQRTVWSGDCRADSPAMSAHGQTAAPTQRRHLPLEGSWQEGPPPGNKTPLAGKLLLLVFFHKHST